MLRYSFLAVNIRQLHYTPNKIKVKWILWDGRTMVGTYTTQLLKQTCQLCDVSSNTGGFFLLQWTFCNTRIVSCGVYMSNNNNMWSLWVMLTHAIVECLCGTHAAWWCIKRKVLNLSVFLCCVFMFCESEHKYACSTSCFKDIKKCSEFTYY